MQAWQDGDLSALEELLDPNSRVVLVGTGRVGLPQPRRLLRLLAERRGDGVNRAEVELIDAGEDVLVSVSNSLDRPDWPDEPATLSRFRDGEAIEMRQLKSREEALTAASQS